MKIILITLLLILSGNILAQSKGDNTIIIKGVGFVQVCTALLDAGYVIDKKDNDLYTVKTEFKQGTGKNKWMKLLIKARVKDSVATLTGDWYNTMALGQKLFGNEQTIESLTMKTEYTYGNPKNCFKEMQKFALSFSKPVEYLKL